MSHGVEISIANGRTKLVVDGDDLSNVTHGFSLSQVAGELPMLAVEVVAMDEATVSIDGAGLAINGVATSHSFELQLMRSLIDRNPVAARRCLDSRGAEVELSDARVEPVMDMGNG